MVLINLQNDFGIRLLVDGIDSNVTSPQRFTDGTWHSTCFAWSPEQGYYKLFLDGSKIISDWKAVSLCCGGIVVFGQDQDLLGGGFDAGQAFGGSLTDINMWSRLLEVSEMESWTAGNKTLEGDWVNWSTSVFSMYGDVQVCHT